MSFLLLPIHRLNRSLHFRILDIPCSRLQPLLWHSTRSLSCDFENNPPLTLRVVLNSAKRFLRSKLYTIHYDWAMDGRQVFGTSVSPSLSTCILRLAAMVETGMREIY